MAITKSSRLAIANVNVVPRYEDAELDAMDILIKMAESRIRQHFEPRKSKLQGLLIEGKGKHLIPALINYHVHYGPNAACFTPTIALLAVAS